VAASSAEDDLAAPPLLTWDHERRIAEKIAATLECPDAIAVPPGLPEIVGGQFALVADKCFNVTSLLMAITGRTTQFPMSASSFLDGMFESEPGFALAQLPLELRHLCDHGASNENSYDGGLFAVLTLAGSLLRTTGENPAWPDSHAERLLFLRSLANSLRLQRPPGETEVTVYGAEEQAAFRRCWLRPIETWPYRKLTPPPEPLLSTLIPAVLALGTLAFRFWAGLSHFTWEGIPDVFDGTERAYSDALKTESKRQQLARLITTYQEISVFNLPDAQTGSRFSDRIDDVGRWDFSQ